MAELKTFEVHWGDFRDPSIFTVEAKNSEHAKTLFRKKYGFNHIKIQRVVEIK